VQRSELITRVKIKLDEYTPTDVALPFDNYIGPLLDESARDLLERGPLRLMTPSSIPLTGTVTYADDKAYILVPSDYVRLYEIRYPLWKRSVRVAISRENPNYQIQENEYLRGGYGRPCVAIVETATVNGGTVAKYLECSKVVDPEGTTLTPIATYVKTDVAENINDLLTDALTWLCCSKILLVMGYGDKAGLAMEQSNNALMQLAT
jgi:hypothetical protein